jgi:hypothetical protein
MTSVFCACLNIGIVCGILRAECLKGHCTTPFCWLEKGDDHAITPIGGRDYLAAWTRETFKEDAALMATVDSLSPQNGFSFFLTELTNLGAGHATDPELAQTAALQ